MTEFPVVAARNLSPQEAELRAEECYKLDQEIKAGLRTGRESMWDVARALYEFDSMNAWTGLGYDSLTHWLADPELGMSRAHYYKLVGVYHELAVLRQVDVSRLKQIEPVKLQIVLPSVKSGKVQLEDALDDAQALGRRDLRDRYFSRPSPETDESRHEEVDGEVVVPLNPTDDTPVWAGDTEPAQIEDTGHSDQLRRVVETVEWLDIALRPGAGSEVMGQALAYARELLTELFPQADGTDAA
ncbi:hypothetical protein UFOVP1313_34 [uncultured Caudovirales phage]|uniref:Uncharacterized protein n=1 Tax=uncultured Caudovirales phage TaxID=2100421 RepID=A0A6J5RKA2_9CAUD|nr:hypothetical protein UFOVP1313_34 [uncultured Caudovirales phage]